MIMKKAALFISAIMLIAGLAFAQEPQKPVKSTDPVKKTETTTTKSTSGCTKVNTKDCPGQKDPKACCAHGTDKKTETTTTEPEKK
jgi:hypothetical protein